MARTGPLLVFNEPAPVRSRTPPVAVIVPEPLITPPAEIVPLPVMSDWSLLRVTVVPTVRVFPTMANVTGWFVPCASPLIVSVLALALAAFSVTVKVVVVKLPKPIVTVSIEVGSRLLDQFAAVFQLPVVLFFQLTVAIALPLRSALSRFMARNSRAVSPS